MATADPGALVFAGAQLCFTPNDLFATSGFPWGGTSLGMVRNVVVKVGRKTSLIREESLGPMPFNGVDLGEAWVMVGSFRTYDPDAVQKTFASTAAGASTGVRQVIYPNGNNYRAGGLLSDLGFKLLLTPDDYERGRFVYFYNAVPLTDEDAALPYQRGEEWVDPFRFIALPDASNRTVVIGLREDLDGILT